MKPTFRYNYPEHPGLEVWLNHGERGVSSEAIMQKLVHNNVRRGFNDPADPGDFRRCEMLLRQVPTLRAQFHRMAEISERWKYLVAHWSEIATLLECEGTDVWGDMPRFDAPRTYALMNPRKATA